MSVELQTFVRTRSLKEKNTVMASTFTKKSIIQDNADKVLVSLAEYEEEARKKLEPNTVAYFSSGANDEFTLGLNRSSYKKLRIRPRILRDVSIRTYEIDIFDDHVKLPIGICPTASQKLAHPDGELGIVRAAEKAGIVYTLSTLSTTSIEEIAATAPNCVKWFQLNIFKDREISKKLVNRAREAGFKAIVLTVDAQVIGMLRFESKCGVKKLGNYKFANLENDVDKKEFSLVENYFDELDQSLNWNDLKWLVEYAKLPVLVKGILTKEDAILALKYGAKGIIVLNHGGRQLDSAPGTIEALPEIIDAIGGMVPIIVDGGVRQGTDIFKALALGATMVFFGRPSLWGLAVGGQAGVENVIEIIRKELDNTMALTGCTSLSDIRREMVVHKNHYLKFYKNLT